MQSCVKSPPPTYLHPAFLQSSFPSCFPTNSVKTLKGKYCISWTCSVQSHVGSSNLVFVMSEYASGLIGGLLVLFSIYIFAGLSRVCVL